MQYSNPRLGCPLNFGLMNSPKHKLPTERRQDVDPDAPIDPGPRPARRSWTDEEDRILRRSYTKHGSRHAAELLGRSITSIQHRATVLGLKGHGQRPWTEGETVYLRKNYGARTVAQIARTLKRSEQSVRAQIHRLKLSENTTRPWSREEEEYIRKHYGKVRVAELAEDLDRTPDAVELKAARLGVVRKVPKLTEKQVKWVLDNVGRLPFSKMATELGVNHNKLIRLAAQHGYRARPNNRPWTDEDDAYLRQNYAVMSQKAIAEALRRSVATVGWRAGKLGLTRRTAAERRDAFAGNGAPNASERPGDPDDNLPLGLGDGFLSAAMLPDSMLYS